MIGAGLLVKGSCRNFDSKPIVSFLLGCFAWLSRWWYWEEEQMQVCQRREGCATRMEVSCNLYKAWFHPGHVIKLFIDQYWIWFSIHQLTAELGRRYIKGSYDLFRRASSNRSELCIGRNNTMRSIERICCRTQSKPCEKLKRIPQNLHPGVLPYHAKQPRHTLRDCACEW